MRAYTPINTGTHNTPYKNKLPQQKGYMERLNLENKLSLSSTALKQEENKEKWRNKTHTIGGKKKTRKSSSWTANKGEKIGATFNGLRNCNKKENF